MLHVIDEGAGPPVVLLHAYPCDATMWDGPAEALVAAGRRVVRPDLPGFGGSPVPAGDPDLAVMADAVFATVDRLGIDGFALGGLSMGGYVAMAMLRQQPGRIDSLLLLDTKATADGGPARAVRAETARKARAAGSIGAMADAMIPGLLGATTIRMRPDAVARTRAFIAAAAGEAAAWAMAAMAARPDSLADLAAFARPALVVMGEEDALSPLGEHEAMAQALPAGRLVVLPGCGHLSAIERPDAVGAAMTDFLLAAG